MNRSLLIFFLLLICPCDTKANQFSIIHYQNENGLEAVDLFGITQDNDGYIWIGSNEGLYRFDGNQFRNYGNDYGIHARLITRNYLMEDSSLLLVGQSPAGIYKMKKDKVVQLSNSDIRPYNGNTFATGFGGKKRYFYTNGAKKKLYCIQSDGVKKIAALGIKKDAFLFQSAKQELFGAFKEKKGLYRLNGTSFEAAFPEQFLHRDILSITGSPQGDLWVLSTEGLYHKNPWGKWTHTMKHKLPAEINIAQMIIDRNQNIWLRSLLGEVYFMDTKSFTTTEIGPQLNKGVQATYLFKDKEEHIWISTLGAGLYCMFNSDFTNFTREDGLPGNYITELAIGADKKLYIGSNFGMSSIAMKGNAPFLENIGSTNYIKGLSALHDGTIICGLGNEKPFRMKNILFLSSFKNGYQLQNGRIIIGSWGRINELTMATPPKKDLLIKLRGSCQRIVEKQGYVWVLTKHKLVKTKDLIDWEEVEIPLQKTGHKGYEIEFNDMLFDQDGVLWLATSNGVYHYKEQWAHVSKEDNLSSNQCKSLRCDNKGRIWIGTERGVNLLDGEKIFVYTSANGLISDKINTLEYDTFNNRIWIGTASGLSMLDLNKHEVERNKKYPLLIDRLEVVGDTLFDMPAQVELNSDQQHLKIFFSCLNYNNPQEVSFEYRLSNKEDWIQTKKNWVEYHSLSPGEYTFEVQSKVYASTFNAPEKFHFSIAYPIWQQNWFLALFSLAGISILYTAVRFRISSIRKEEKEKREHLVYVNHLERQALHANMKPHFIFNALNSIQHYLVKHKDLKGINYVAEFAQLIRGNMEISLGELVVLHQEIKQLERYIRLENIRLGNKMSFDIHIDESLEPSEIKIPSMIIQPFVENAIWHGIAPLEDKGMLKIRFIMKAAHIIQIDVEDNGVGFKSNSADHNHISRGIFLIKERIALLSPHNEIQIEHLKDEDGKASGTLVKIMIHNESKAG